ncbi:unnamed protein product [Adineta ricciae]|uniref:PKD/REJ-like domain-containing protein n=1 Tax=Adineta ricciae TaxID=249248 RepID=A0A816E1S8_ADIRI|nr:unnamed protein product [Adineta ricciae]
MLTSSTTSVTSTSSTLSTSVSFSTSSTSSTTSTTMSTLETSQTPAINESCYPPSIILIPGQSSLLSPLVYRRSQDFSISSLLKLACASSLSTTIQWSIKNCTVITCITPITLSTKICTTLSEIYIPSRTLALGVYQFTISVKMTKSPQYRSSSVTYIRITPSGITANLVELGTSMITRGDKQDLFFDPGTYSVDPDEDSFDASKWKYVYYCRIYPRYQFPNLQGIFLPIEDLRVDPVNPSCLSGNGTQLIFGNSSSSPKSSLTIRAGSLQTNEIYQFMVYMENRKNSSVQATGYVLVTVEVTRPQLIIIGCVISTMCIPNLEFQLLNPTTQVALTSFCTGICDDLQSITWNIYEGSTNSSTNSTVIWKLFPSSISYENIWFFGTYINNFTADNRLFINNPHVQYWRFEAVYSFLNATSSSALNFIMNQSPINGSCVIYPQNGTTSTWFNVSCPNWADEDEVKDYSLYVWKTNNLQKIIVAYSPESTFQVQLPPGDNQTSLLNIVIHIRDTLDCVTIVNMTQISVFINQNEINDLQNLANLSNNNPIVQLLWSGNQNIVGQIVNSVSQTLNQMNTESINNAISNGLVATEIFVSSLESTSTPKTISTSSNNSFSSEYEKDLNNQANVRDYLVNFYANLLITTSNSIILQSSSLAQLTQSTNQLTRNVLQIASDRCYQLTIALYSLKTKISFEDMQTAATQLIQCASNVLIGINGVLQERMLILDSDYSRANSLSDDYNTDIESEWSNLNLFADGNDFSIETIEKNRNIYYQKQLANEIATKANEIILLLTSSLNIHINLGQSLTINTSTAFMSLQTISNDSLSNKIVTQPDNGQFQIPTNITVNNSSIFLRSMMTPLPSFGSNQSQSNTNLSRSISLSLFDKNGIEISVETNMINRIRMIIVVHLEIHPLNSTLSYLFIYKFDQTPLLNSSINFIDGWTIFCPSRKSNE